MSLLNKIVNLIRKKEQIDSPRRGFGLGAGIVIHEDTAMTVSAFNRGVIYISSQIAKLPWHIKNSKNEIQSGSLSNLLDLSPNPEMNSYQFRLCMIQNALIHGNAFAEIERNAIGRPIALWPIEASRVEVLRASTGELLYRVSGGGANFEDVYLNPFDVFHVRNLHTKDGILGQGIVAYAIQTLGISAGADQMAANLFANGAIPSGVIEVTGVLGDEAFERIKTSWKEAHSGRKSAGIAVLEEGAKFNPITINPDVLQFLDSRKFSVIEIARFLGLPPSKLFDSDAGRHGNTENQNLEVATDTLDAWAKNLEMEADIKVLNNRFGGRHSELDLYAVFRGDMATRADYFSKRMQTASMTPNEIRMREGDAPYTDGDRFFVAINNYSPADRIDEIIDSQVQSKNAPKATPNSGAEDALTKAALDFLTTR
jgi:HK97 family phage portal protein